jgi:glucosamine-6-phosphate deaminase
MEIIVAKNYHEMSMIAADLAMRQLKRKKTSVLGLATGDTPIGFYRELARANHRGDISFKKVTTFNLDEFVGLDDTDRGSLFYYMRKHLFDKVDLEPKRINMLDGRAKNIKAECHRFEQLIKKAGGVDWQLLGIGANGHIGWNEPGTSFKSRTHALNLTIKSRRAQAVNFKSIKDVPKQGLTMGIGTIMEAKQLVLLADGQEKARIIREALRGRIRQKVPATALQRHPNLVVIIDEEAASIL